jgi:hypothetical protein
MAAMNNPEHIFNDYLEDTLLIDDVAVRNALNEQGLMTFADLQGPMKTDIKNICSNIRKPGYHQQP